MALSEVGSGSQRADDQTTGTSLQVAFPGNVTAGNLLIVAGCAYRFAGSAVTPLVSDSRGTSYTVVVGTNITSNNDNLRPFIAFGIAPSSGACTVTVDSNDVLGMVGFSVDEFDGDDPVASVNGGATTGTGTTPGDSLTTAADGELVVGAMVQSQGDISIDAGSGYTLMGEFESGFAKFATEFKIAGSAGAETPSFTLGESRDWSAISYSFKENVVVPTNDALIVIRRA